MFHSCFIRGVSKTEPTDCTQRGGRAHGNNRAASGGLVFVLFTDLLYIDLRRLGKNLSDLVLQPINLRSERQIT